VSVLFLTVPTAGRHPDLLAGLVRDCGLPPDRIVVVATAPGVEVADGVVVVRVDGPLNIQRWWLAGIQECVRRGATQVAIVNDDVVLPAASLAALAAALDETGAAVASPGPAYLHVTTHLPVGRGLDGALWVLDVRTDLRPDPRFVWWYGDDDVDLRARRDHGGLVQVPVEWEHRHASSATDASPALQALLASDQRTFRRIHRRSIIASRALLIAIALKARVRGGAAGPTRRS